MFLHQWCQLQVNTCTSPPVNIQPRYPNSHTLCRSFISSIYSARGDRKEDAVHGLTVKKTQTTDSPDMGVTACCILVSWREEYGLISSCGYNLHLFGFREGPGRLWSTNKIAVEWNKLGTHLGNIKNRLRKVMDEEFGAKFPGATTVASRLFSHVLLRKDMERGLKGGKIKGKKSAGGDLQKWARSFLAWFCTYASPHTSLILFFYKLE